MRAREARAAKEEPRLEEDRAEAKAAKEQFRIIRP